MIGRCGDFPIFQHAIDLHFFTSKDIKMTLTSSDQGNTLQDEDQAKKIHHISSHGKKMKN